MDHRQTATYFPKFFLCFLILCKTFFFSMLLHLVFITNNHCHDYQLKLSSLSSLPAEVLPLEILPFSIQLVANSFLWTFIVEMTLTIHLPFFVFWHCWLSLLCTHLAILVRSIRIVKTSTEVFDLVLYESGNWGLFREIKQIAQNHSFI